MRLFRTDLIALACLAVLAIAICFDLFLHKGPPATMDGLIHITTIEQFSRAIKAGEFPVSWLDKFANYGQPVPLYAHQLPAYIGAGLTFITQDPVLSFNLLMFTSVLLSSWLFYLFLRLYFPPCPSFVASLIFSLSPYRVLDIYIRGDLPELMSQIFLPLTLIGIYLGIIKRQLKGFYLMLFSFALLSLTHPLMLIVYSFFIIPYTGFLFLTTKIDSSEKFKLLLLSCFAALIGVGIASYYLLPLDAEIKYFYIERTKQVDSSAYLSWQNYFLERWQTHLDNGTFTRVQILQIGLPEMLIILVGITFAAKEIILNKKGITLMSFCIFIFLFVAIFTLPICSFIYQHTFLKNIQYPWRMFALLQFIPPIIIASLAQKTQNIYLLISVALIILIIRSPQLYGRRYTNYPRNYYDFTTVNLYSILFNPVWTGKAESYPVVNNKSSIISGKGNIIKSKIANSSRQYTVSAITGLRMVDYTFYFPGWTVSIDGHLVPIQYQDPAYRGIITYQVPSGIHNVNVTYQDTKIRQVGKILSATFLLVAFIFLLYRKKLEKI